MPRVLPRFLTLIPLLLWTASARGESVHIALDYRAAEPDCPSKNAFERFVLARSPIADFGALSADALTARVRVAPSERQQFIGSVSFESAHEANGGERSIEGGSCLDVAQALAFVVALRTRHPGDVDVRRSEIAPLPERPAVPSAKKPRWTFGTFASGGVRSGTSPVLAPMVGASIEVRRTGDAWIAPRFRMSGLHAWSESTSTQGTMKYQLMTSAVDACVVQLPLHRERASLCPIARLEIGSQRAVGIEGQGRGAGSGAGLWLAASGMVRAQTTIARGLTLELDAGALFPLVRNEIVRGIDSTVSYSIPAVAWTAAANVGWTFW